MAAAAATSTTTARATAIPRRSHSHYPDFGEEEEQQVSPRSRSRTTKSQHHASSRERESRRAHKRSPQRIKSRPANPAVINSILDSLDTLSPPPIITGEERSSDTDSRSSRPRSPHSAAGSLAPSATSPGFGVEYGSRPALDDDEGVTDAALPPTIRTSRPPSGLSNYAGEQRRASFTSGSPGKATRSVSRRSSRSSLNQVKRAVSPISNKLSAASWVKQNSMSSETLATRASGRSKGRSLRRINSQESLRNSRTEIRFVPPAPEEESAEPPPNISRAEHIVSKASRPRVASSKRRLFLMDEGSEERVPQMKAREDSQDEMRSASPPPDIRRGSGNEVVGGAEEVTTPHRISPLSNPIVDSIPMRTSSLRQKSSSPKPGKKKKSKRSSTKGNKIDSKTNSLVADREAETIPEASWADLGEDDETVKRIRELREQRKSRLLDSRAFSMPATVPTSATASTPEANHEPLPPRIDAENVRPEPTSAAQGEEVNKRESRPGPDRAATVDATSKAHKVLGITAESPTHGLSDQRMNAEDLMRARKYSLEQSRPPMRPGTALSAHSIVTPPLSLDYSYAQAVDALQGTEGEIRRREQQPPSSMKPSPLKTTYLDLVSAETPLRDTSPTVSRKPSAKRRQDRWTLHHPDLPLDAEKKRSRRKSTSDARLDRDGEATPAVPRRDSVDVAVLQYLQNERLSRKLRHPQTGRVIAFSEVGDPNGSAVFVCLGMGLTRYVTAFYDELATTLRLRLITIDRPGVGSSEPYPSSDRSGPLSWPDDVLAICQHLGIQSFSLLAHSAGAIYALASALILPHMIRGKVHLLAPWIPPSQLQAVSHSAATTPAPAAGLPRSQRFLRVLPTPFLKAANSSFMTATSASLKPATKRTKTAAKLETIHQNTISDYPTAKQSPSHPARPSTSDGHARPDFTRRESMMLMDQFMPSMNPLENFPLAPADADADDPALSRKPSFVMSATATPMDPSFEYASAALDAAEHEAKQRKQEFTARLTQATWELATKDSNPATDLLVCLERTRDVGFRYTDVTREVVVTHGSEDRRVPVGNVKWLAEQMNRRALSERVSGARESVESGIGKGVGGCEVRVLEGEGHGLMASPLIMGDVLTEIAGYWAASKRFAVAS